MTSRPQSVARSNPGLKVNRFFTKPGKHPYDQIDWALRSALINNERGEMVFEQADVEAPANWSQLAINIVVSKYFRGHLGTPERETSVKQMIDRVATTIADWGRKDGYFASDKDGDAFEQELRHLLVNQMMAFNSPVWFNVGWRDDPQTSACFINSVEDDMGSIMDLAKTEAMLFKFGSGAGVNLSKIRGSGEKLSGGGTASGPLSFMKGYDSFAGVVKSGGSTRRAAKMIVLDADHPDIEDFIESKVREERKAHALIAAGYDSSFTGEAYQSVQYQNANHSVRVTDDFMRAVEDDGAWQLTARTDGAVMKELRARQLLRQMAQAAWASGDPGIQYDTTINDWHTCANTDRIYATNPCGEFDFLNDTACNLASFNLMKFEAADGAGFDIAAYRQAVRITITAMEILVGNSSYPTEKIAKNSHDYRPLGLGYANLGAYLMTKGMAYDSDHGRAIAAGLTAIMGGEAYAQSARIARDCGGPFAGYEKNREPMLRVIGKHRTAAFQMPDSPLSIVAYETWDEALELGEKYGYRNAQALVIAPTGTIAFLMDCATTGIEPDIALIKYKKLVGEGYLRLVNESVPEALRTLDYDDEQVAAIIAYIDEHETIEGAPELDPAHLPIFDCAFKPANGTRSIEPMGHVHMMAAVQPFISGAISKTINLPEAASVEDVEKVYLEGWKLGLKALAIYRDNSKKSQPLNTGKKTIVVSDDVSGDVAASLQQHIEELEGALEVALEQLHEVESTKTVVPTPKRRRLDQDRNSYTHKFSVGGHEGYLIIGLYPEGEPGEIFIKMAKEGSTVSGFTDAWATSLSIALQYGVPLRDLIGKFAHSRFEPSGFTINRDIPMAKSIVDYVARYLGSRFLTAEERSALGVLDRSGPDGGPMMMVDAASSTTPPPSVAAVPAAPSKSVAPSAGGTSLSDLAAQTGDTPPCPSCGSLTVRSGTCATCLSCGTTTGCS